MPRFSKIVRANCEISVSSSDGRTPTRFERNVIANIIDPKINDIIINVVPAFLERGSLNAVMPSEIASTPVTAVVPLANAFNIKNAVMG
ncbi:MAG: hypothetical protein ACD_34C00129G0002 [uncultured bacterium]|nr:MAG: hypothetical protein ACD_34C00129G0002 [uncultured bacterium]